MSALPQRRTVVEYRLHVRAFPAPGWANDQLRVRHVFFVMSFSFFFFMRVCVYEVQCFFLSGCCCCLRVAEKKSCQARTKKKQKNNEKKNFIPLQNQKHKNG